MNKIKFITNKKVLSVTTALLLTFSGCKVEEDPYSLYTPESFYTSETQVLSSLSGVYRNFAGLTGMGAEYRIMELPADQVVVHAKIQGWWGGPDWEQLMEHKWDANHPYFNGSWNSFFATVGQVNALTASLDAAGLDNVKGPKAELRTLRAYAYFYLLDLFGNVPIFTLPKVDPKNLPNQNTKAEVFNFIVKEIIEAAADLPSEKVVGNEYYGRFTKEAAYALLATVYLNAQVYTGSPQHDKTIEYADLVINSGEYNLLPNYFDNFKPDNAANKEMIFGAVYTPEIAGGLGQPLVQKVLPGINGGLFGLPYTPQNGFATREAIYNAYENQDMRKNMFLPHGPMKDPRNGEVVMVERIVADNNSNLFKPGVSTVGPVPYVIIPATGIRSQPMNAGIKWIKWGLDSKTIGGNAGNDIAFIRYADVLLMKAEALQRKNASGALAIVNLIRARSKASSLGSVNLDDILAERGRELAFEMTRRRDLIRFGKFQDAWEFKAASESFRSLYPIPQAAINANPKLKQNTGY
jgi:hypothetical protein